MEFSLIMYVCLKVSFLSKAPQFPLDSGWRMAYLLVIDTTTQRESP